MLPGFVKRSSWLVHDRDTIVDHLHAVTMQCVLVSPLIPVIGTKIKKRIEMENKWYFTVWPVWWLDMGMLKEGLCWWKNLSISKLFFLDHRHCECCEWPLLQDDYETVNERPKVGIKRNWSRMGNSGNLKVVLSRGRCKRLSQLLSM